MVEKKEAKVKTIYEKLMCIQEKLKAPKSQKNTFGNFMYRSCEDILEAAKPLLKEMALVIIFTDEIVPMDMRCYVKATAKLTDGAEEILVSAFAREPLAKKGMDEMQITGAAGSYARKYALNGLFAIDDNKDSDKPNGEEQKPKEKFQEILDKAFDEYSKAVLPMLEENNDMLDMDKFIKAVQKEFGKLPTTVKSIPLIVKKIKIKDVLAEKPKDEKPKAEKPKENPPKNEIVEQAFFNYTTEHKEDLPEGWLFDAALFEKAILKHFPKLPTNPASIKKINATITPNELMVEMAEELF